MEATIKYVEAGKIMETTLPFPLVMWFNPMGAQYIQNAGIGGSQTIMTVKIISIDIKS